MNYRDKVQAGMSLKVVQALMWQTRDERWYQQKLIKELPRYKQARAIQQLREERKAGEEV